MTAVNGQSPPAPADVEGPRNLMRSRETATTSAGPSAFRAGSSGGTAPSLGTGVIGAEPTLRITSRSAGFGWVYPARPMDGAAVTPGRTYTATVSARTVSGRSGPRSGAAHVTWYDANGRWISGADGPARAVVPDELRTASVTATAPPLAAYAVPQWQNTEFARIGDTVEITRLGVSDGSTATPWSAPAPVGPTNLMRSREAATTSAGAGPFSAGSTGGTAPALSAGTRTPDGSPTLRVTARSNGYNWVYPSRATDGAPVTAGRVYTATVTVRPVLAQSGPRSGAAHITWFDKNGRWLSGSDGAGIALVAGELRTLSVTATAPPAAAFAVPQWQDARAASAGDSLELTNFGLSAGTTAAPWSAP